MFFVVVIDVVAVVLLREPTVVLLREPRRNKTVN